MILHFLTPLPHSLLYHPCLVLLLISVLSHHYLSSLPFYPQLIPWFFYYLPSQFLSLSSIHLLNFSRDSFLIPLPTYSHLLSLNSIWPLFLALYIIPLPYTFTPLLRCHSLLSRKPHPLRGLMLKPAGPWMDPYFHLLIHCILIVFYCGGRGDRIAAKY